MSVSNQVTLLFRCLPFALAIRITLLSFFRRFLSGDAYLSYSQMGEDRLIANLLPDLDRGFYVEVGSNEPIHFSNTFGFYCKGWRGITIDANEHLVEKHRQLRLKDIPVCAAVSNVESEVVFTEYDMHELNTIDQRTVAMLQKQQEVRVVAERRLKTRTLTDILQQHLPTAQAIDFLSIDVEGHDLEVLLSLDLTVYRPRLIVIEMHSFQLENYARDEIYTYLITNGYVFSGYAVWNGFFIDERHFKASDRQ
jgi:FkbM family methyltransferase